MTPAQRRQYFGIVSAAAPEASPLTN